MIAQGVKLTIVARPYFSFSPPRDKEKLGLAIQTTLTPNQLQVYASVISTDMYVGDSMLEDSCPQLNIAMPKDFNYELLPFIPNSAFPIYAVLILHENNQVYCQHT